MFDKYPIRESLIIFVVDQYLQYGQSEYVRNFGMTIEENPLSTQARVIEPPKLKYNVASLQPSIVSPLLLLTLFSLYKFIPQYSNQKMGHGICWFFRSLLAIVILIFLII